MTLPFLTDDMIAKLVYPLTQPAAQCKALREMGFHVIVRPDGRPVVGLANFERVTKATAEEPSVLASVVPLGEFNEAKLIERHGKKARYQPTQPS